jgi:hypothetical protein
VVEKEYFDLEELLGLREDWKDYELPVEVL